MGQRPGRLRIVVEREVAVAPEHELLHPEAVLPEQVLGLVEAPLARGGGGREALHRRPGHRLEGAEVSMVEEPALLEAAHHAEDLAVLLALGPHHELRGGAGRRDAHAALEPRLARETTGQHQVREEVARVVLLPRQATDDRVVRPFQVQRHAGGQTCGLDHLLPLRAGQQLDVHIAGEAFASSQDLDGGQHPVHRAGRAARHARGQEQALCHARAMRLHEGAGDFFG